MSFTRRHLPHWIPEGAAVFVTWRLAGTLPAKELTDDKKRSSVPRSFLEHDDFLDRARSGPVWLQDSRIASVVADALLYGERVRKLYQLHTWVIMPNHVHVILQPHCELPAIMQWLKGRTSRVANRILNRTGTRFWQDESFDHWIRSEEELAYMRDYVENNPIKAGLVPHKEQWRWSSR
jgi:REP element-mobilizing transposase RayT